MTETPNERAERARRMLEHCRNRRTASVAHIEGLCIDLDEVAQEHSVLLARVAELESGRNQLRHVVDDQAHRIQSGLDRIAELEAERDRLETELREVLTADGSVEYDAEGEL